MVEVTGKDVESEWGKRKRRCDIILSFGIGAFSGVIASMDNIELPNELTRGASIVFYVSIFLIVVSLSFRIYLYRQKEKKIKNMLGGIFHP